MGCSDVAWRYIRVVCFLSSEREADMDHVEGKVAFITGGASGIGLGMAKAFIKAGMKVVIADIRQELLDEAASSLGDSKNLRAMRLDVTDRAAMSRAADEVERFFDKIHVVCNNAGVIALESGDPTYEDWDWRPQDKEARRRRAHRQHCVDECLLCRTRGDDLRHEQVRHPRHH